MKAIDDINMAILADITKSNTAKNAIKLKKLQLTEEYHLAVLQALFSSGKQDGGGEARGAEVFKGSMKRINRQKPSWADEENYTAFDYFEHDDSTFGFSIVKFAGCITFISILWRFINN
ncbi:hypothetical protein OS493_036080 [Desmophyllum pertusum]|uniref:Uncharacterized protein n=1 Tax=Desmophyllum pertusum TaxID=174260 RepID=A0A9X0CHW2_9CNID|nr:hypothetical protein OS493_036080 [Desmophyllum pertusum]